MPFNCFDHTDADLVSNLALDEALLLAVDAGELGDCLRLWEWSTPAVVLGANGVLVDEAHVEACQRDGVPIVRRSSGGGTVLLGRGCLQYSLVMNFEQHPELCHVGESYRWVAERLARGLQSIAPVQLLGSSDLCWANRKFSGNAQQRKTKGFLHHGTLLYQFDIALMERYLKPPPRQPDYRETRSHSAFVVNLPTDQSTLKQALIREFEAERAAIPANVQQQAVELTTTKYATPAWISRR